MAQQVVTELVIDSKTAGADEFSRKMDQASGSAQQTVLAVAGVSVAFVGALVALRGFVDYVGNANKQLIDIDENARSAGMSTREFQQTLFAARASGVTEKDFISGLDRIGADLTAASRGVTEFGKLFEVNGISIKNVNGELKTTKQALGDIAGLMNNATPAIQQGIAGIVGLTKDWVPFLRQGGDAIEDLKKQALDLGVVIDDDVIQKAKIFDAEWKTAIAAWDLQFKASLASILPLLVKMAGLATTIIDGVGSVISTAGRWLTPDDDKSKAQLNDQINDVYRLREALESLGNLSGGSFAAFRARNLAGLVGLPEDATIQQVDALLGKLSALYDKKPTPVTITGGSTVLPPSGERNDHVDRAINSLRKHTEQTLADAAAQGLGAAAFAKFRAEAAETTAVQANGGKETAKQAKQFKELIHAATNAADALARRRVASEIQFSGRTTFLSAEDVKIAQQLRGIYGNDIPAALGSSYAAAIRTNDAFREVASGIETNLTSGLTDIAMGTKSVSRGFNDMGLAIVRALEQAIIKLLIIQPLMQALQGGLSGLGLGFGSFGGGSPSIVSDLGAGTGGLSFPAFANGTDSAPGGWSTVGEYGPERMYVPPGAQIVPNGRSGSNDNGPNIIFNVIEDSSRAGQREQTGTGNGGFEITQFVDAITARNVGNPGSATRQTLAQAGRVASR